MPSIVFTDSDLDDLADRLADRIAQRLATDGGTSNNSAGAGKLLWTEKEAAACLGVSALTLRNWRSRGVIESTTTTRPVLYDRAAIERVAAFIVETGNHHAGTRRQA